MFNLEFVSHVEEDAIQSILRKNDAWYGVYIDKNAVAVEINWGDWKHDHLWCDYILSENGCIKIDEQLTEEDGSDCYSSIHYYRKVA